jgi:hypothetical protein
MSGDAADMTVSLLVEPADLRRAMRVMYRHSRALRTAVALTLSFPIWIFVPVGLLHLPPVSGAVSYVLLAALIYSIVPRLARHRGSSTSFVFHVDGDQGVGQWEIELHADGWHLAHEGRQYFISWADSRRASSYDEGILANPKPPGVVFIPSRAFASREEQDAFCARAEELRKAAVASARA